MGSLEEELPPGHDEEVLEWAENYEKMAYGSLMVQIDEVFIEARSAIGEKKDTIEIMAKLGKAARLLSRQAEYLAGNRMSNYFRPKNN
jgi:hypothetical protein